MFQRNNIFAYSSNVAYSEFKQIFLQCLDWVRYIELFVLYTRKPTIHCKDRLQGQMYHVKICLGIYIVRQNT